MISMREWLIKSIGSFSKTFATFSFGYIKGRIDAKKKLKKDNQHIIDIIDNK